MKSNFTKLNSLNPMCKYEFSNIILNHLGIKSKYYTINEITNFIKTIMFKGESKKDVTWEDKDTFKTNANTISFNNAVKYVMNNYIIRESNEPDCLFYYYYELPVEVTKGQFDSK